MSGLDTWRRVAFGLGSNLGNRLEHLQSAVTHILGRPTVAPVKASKVYETDPVGVPDQPDFLNAVLVVDTTITVAGLLNLAHECEATAGRIRSNRWGPRTLDVDVLAVAGVLSNDPALILPHPRIAEREFVLRPWADADPSFVVVGTDTVQDLLARVEPGGVRVTDLRLEVSG
jgi:2-amino-4-hydroxy-6-hydroxymethyldihydropteridine diphosphokinase